MLCLLARLCAAEVFKYVDAEGKANYVTRAEDVPDEFRPQTQRPHDLPALGKVESQPGVDLPILNRSLPPALAYHAVAIYVTEWCPYCRRLEEFLKTNKIRYTRYDIEKSAIGRKRHIELGGGGVPVVVVGKQVIRGFDERAIRKALGR
jgi:glutaredoxin